MKINAINSPSTSSPPAILFIQRRARVSEAQARVVAELYGLPLDPWQHVGALTPATSDRRAQA